MYSLSRSRFFVRSGVTRCCDNSHTARKLLCTAPAGIPRLSERNGRFLENMKNSEETNDFQKKVLKWDKKLPVPEPPPMEKLVNFLVKRRSPSCSTSLRRGLDKMLVSAACGMLGLHRAHDRLSEKHSKDPLNNCWYSPSNHGDTFGIRHDEIYFHEQIIPSQPVTSYAVLIPGSPRHAGTAAVGGIGENGSSFVDAPTNINPEIMVDRAASLVCGLLKARDFYLSDEFTQDVMKGTPLSMQWYSYIFSCTMQFVPGCIERYKAPESHSKHVIVMVRGNMYKVILFWNDKEGEEKRITLKQLKEKLKDVLDVDASKEPSTPIPVLTSITPSERCQEEQRLKCLSERNVSNLALIRDALFIVALDPDDSPRTANETMFALHSGNFVNRWYDKSVQLVVFGNGVAGFVNNYLAGMTGTVGTNFVQIAVGSESTPEGEVEKSDKDMDISPAPSSLTWDDTSDGHFKQKIKNLIKTSRTSGPFKPPSQDVFKICLGSSFESICKAHKVTPGGAFQAGMQLALAKIAGRFMSVNEVVSIRHLRFGGMTFMDSSMADMRLFVETARKMQNNAEKMTKKDHAALKELLTKAIQSYKDEVLGYKRGEMNMWHLDSLYRTLGLPNRLPFRNSQRLDMRTRLKEVALNYLRGPLINLLPPPVAENVTSNPSWYPEIEAIGRPGVKCILPPNSMALHYMFGGDAISITVNANPQHPCYERGQEFVEELERSLEFVKDLLATK